MELLNGVTIFATDEGIVLGNVLSVAIIILTLVFLIISCCSLFKALVKKMHLEQSSAEMTLLKTSWALIPVAVCILIAGGALAVTAKMNMQTWGHEYADKLWVETNGMVNMSEFTEAYNIIKCEDGKYLIEENDEEQTSESTEDSIRLIDFLNALRDKT